MTKMVAETMSFKAAKAVEVGGNLNYKSDMAKIRLDFHVSRQQTKRAKSNGSKPYTGVAKRFITGDKSARNDSKY